VSKWTKFGLTALVVTVAAGCSDSTSSGTQQLSTDEKAALTSALSSTEFGGLATYVIQTVGSVGSLTAATNAAMTQAVNSALSLAVQGVNSPAYEGAVGIAIEFDYSIQGQTSQGWFYGVFGWNDINATAKTVGEWVLVGGVGDAGSLPSSATGTVESGDVFVYYSKSQVPYFGTTGTASVSSSSFGGSTDCSQSSQGVTVDCSYSTGAMNGNFLFSAASESDATYDQSKVQFSSLPAVKMTIAVSQ